MVARAAGAVVLTTPPALKSMMLKCLENLLSLTDVHDVRHGRWYWMMGDFKGERLLPDGGEKAESFIKGGSGGGSDGGGDGDRATSGPASHQPVLLPP